MSTKTESHTEELYNLLMQEIEPDLRMDNLSSLAKKFEALSDEEKTAKLAYYKEKLLEFFDEYSSLLLYERAELDLLHEDMQNFVKQTASKSEQDQLGSLESNFQNS